MCVTKYNAYLTLVKASVEYTIFVSTKNINHMQSLKHMHVYRLAQKRKPS